MLRMTKGFFSGLVAGLTLLAVQTAQAQTITFETVRLNRWNMRNLGDAGFWFANFNAPAPVSGAADDANDRNSLPSWVLPNFADDQTFDLTVSSKGGQPTWATLKLPDGEVGLSGAVVDTNTANNSSNTIQQLNLGPGTPSKFRLYVVTDNTAGEHDPASRLRARAESPEIDGPNAPGGLAGNFNGSPDVYSWIYEGWEAGDFIKLQLNSGNGLRPASIAGIMFDAVPEPSSIMLLAIAAGCGLAARRRG